MKKKPKILIVKSKYNSPEGLYISACNELERRKINFETNEISDKPILTIELKYNLGNPVINTIERVSKPGRRIFSSAESLPKINNGLGIAIVSTPKGVMTDVNARKQKVGGEIICKVF